MRYCTALGCKKKHNSHGYCYYHALKLRKYGDANFPLIPRDGRQKKPEHKAWINMTNRCIRTNHPAYNHYGGRGITICDRWSDRVKGFDNFLADMGERPSSKHSLDRIDNNGNYEPSNCRWTTQIEQVYNRRTSAKTVGVRYVKNIDKWLARLNYQGQQVYSQYFRTEEEAIKARKAAELKYVGKLLG